VAKRHVVSQKRWPIALRLLLPCLEVVRRLEDDAARADSHLWLRKWLHNPKSEAHTRLHTRQHGLLVVEAAAACRRVRRSSASWVYSDENVSRPTLQVSRRVNLSAARDSNRPAGMLHFAWSEKVALLITNRRSRLLPFGHRHTVSLP